MGIRNTLSEAIARARRFDLAFWLTMRITPPVAAFARWWHDRRPTRFVIMDDGNRFAIETHPQRHAARAVMRAFGTDRLAVFTAVWMEDPPRPTPDVFLAYCPVHTAASNCDSENCTWS